MGSFPKRGKPGRGIFIRRQKSVFPKRTIYAEREYGAEPNGPPYDRGGIFSHEDFLIFKPESSMSQFKQTPNKNDV